MHFAYTILILLVLNFTGYASEATNYYWHSHFNTWISNDNIWVWKQSTAQWVRLHPNWKDTQHTVNTQKMHIFYPTGGSC